MRLLPNPIDDEDLQTALNPAISSDVKVYGSFDPIVQAANIRQTGVDAGVLTFVSTFDNATARDYQVIVHKTGARTTRKIRIALNVVFDDDVAGVAIAIFDIPKRSLNQRFSLGQGTGTDLIGLTTAGTKQVETATIVGTITTAGDALVTVYSNDLPGGLLAVRVAVADTDTATIVAGKIRAKLAATPAIAGLFTVGGSTTAVSLTTLLEEANDDTLNIAYADDTCVGLTADPSSADTTAGVANTMNTKKIKSIVSIATNGIGGGASGNQFRIEAAPDEDSFVLIGCTNEASMGLPLGESLPIPCGREASAFVVTGRGEPGKLTVTEKYVDYNTGLSRFNGHYATARVVFLKDQRLVTDQFIFSQWRPIASPTVGDGNDVVTHQATGNFEGFGAFTAK